MIICLRPDIDDVVVATNAILDEVQEALEAAAVSEHEIVCTLAVARRDIECALERFGQKCVDRGRKS